jgi:hypothetical protein
MHLNLQKAIDDLVKIKTQSEYCSFVVERNVNAGVPVSLQIPSDHLRTSQRGQLIANSLQMISYILNSCPLGLIFLDGSLFKEELLIYLRQKFKGDSHS